MGRLWGAGGSPPRMPIRPSSSGARPAEDAGPHLGLRRRDLVSPHHDIPAARHTGNMRVALVEPHPGTYLERRTHSLAARIQCLDCDEPVEFEAPPSDDPTATVEGGDRGTAEIVPAIVKPRLLRVDLKLPARGRTGDLKQAAHDVRTGARSQRARPDDEANASGTGDVLAGGYGCPGAGIHLEFRAQGQVIDT